MRNADTSAAPSGNLSAIGPWHRPRLYLTIVAIFLVVSTTVMFATFFVSRSDTPYNAGGLSAAFTLIIFFWFFIVGSISVTAAILLFKKRNKAVVMSLVALLLMIPTFGATVSYVAYKVGSANDNLTLAGLIPGVSVTAFMIGILAVGYIKRS